MPVVAHLAGDLPGEGLREEVGIGFTDLPEPSCTTSLLPGDRPLTVGSLFSGYGGLDLAVEHHFNAGTI